MVQHRQRARNNIPDRSGYRKASHDFRKQIEARMSDDTASSEVSEKTANVQESFNDNAPAHRPRAVPAHVRRDEDKNSELGGGAEQKGSIVSFEDAIFGVRCVLVCVLCAR